MRIDRAFETRSPLARFRERFAFAALQRGNEEPHQCDDRHINLDFKLRFADEGIDCGERTGVANRIEKCDQCTDECGKRCAARSPG